MNPNNGISSSGLNGIRIALAIRRMKQGFKKRYFPKKEIVISRKGLKNHPYQFFNVLDHYYKYDLHGKLVYFFYSCLWSFTISFFIALIIYDNNFDYVLHVKYPWQMKNFDELVDYISRKKNYFLDNYLFFLNMEKITNKEHFNVLRKKFLNVIFQKEKKEKENEIKQKILEQEKEEIDKSFKKIDDILKKNEDELLNLTK